MKYYFKISFLIFSASFLLISFISFPAQSVEKITTFQGQQISDQFGISLCGAGDFNGDGYQDLLVGANLEDSGGDAAGRCYLYFGGMSADSIPDLTFTGAPGERMGTRVAGGGDINNDGFSDVAVYASGASEDPGRVYLFLGGCSPDGIPDLVLEGSASGDRFGRGLCLNGDLNADGFDDLVVGACEADSTGAVYIYFGGDPMDQDPDLILYGEGAGDFFGYTVDCGGDINGDGEDDLLVGAPRNDESDIWAGKAYAYLCGAAMDTVADAEMTGVSVGDAFGSAAKIIGDINGDSIDDYIVSAPYYNSLFGDDVGKVYFFLGAAIVDGTPDDALVGEFMEEQFGYSISSTDVDGDGTGDMIIGAPGYGGASVQLGKVYLFTGTYPLPATAAFTDVGTDTTSGLGISVAGAGRFTMHSGGGGSLAAGGWNIGGKGAALLYGEEVVVTDSGPPDEGFPHQVEIYPNPTSAGFSINCILGHREEVNIGIYDVAGRKVSDIPAGIHGKGQFVQEWNPASGCRGSLAGGVYFVMVRIGERSFTRKVLIMK